MESMNGLPMLVALDSMANVETLSRNPQENPTTTIRLGELLLVSVVMAANVARDLQSNIRNLVGGRMTHYEKLIDNSLEIGLQELQTKALARGYDGVIGVKIATPNVVTGGVEFLIYGNGYHALATDNSD